MYILRIREIVLTGTIHTWGKQETQSPGFVYVRVLIENIFPVNTSLFACQIDGVLYLEGRRSVFVYRQCLRWQT